MRVELKMPSTGLGYFPGLARPFVADTEALPRDAAREVERLVADARLLDEAESIEQPSPQVADSRQYVLTVEDSGRQRTVRLHDLSDDPALEALKNYLLELRQAAPEQVEDKAAPRGRRTKSRS